MPLTQKPITIEGGCNCRAIRYRIVVPAEEERPFFTCGGETASPKVRAPLILTDHCNDCRAATGAIINHWFVSPLDMVFTSFVARHDSVPVDLRLDRDHPRGPWRPAREAFTATKPSPDDYFAFFTSFTGRRRYFCSRCGTQFGYNVYPMPENWPGVECVDLSLGTIDRENLEGDNLSPERQAWWDVGISWAQKQSLKGLNVPVHPGPWVDKTVQPDQ